MVICVVTYTHSLSCVLGVYHKFVQCCNTVCVIIVWTMILLILSKIFACVHGVYVCVVTTRYCTRFCFSVTFYFLNYFTCLCILHYADTWQIAFWKQISGTADSGTEIVPVVLLYPMCSLVLIIVPFVDSGDWPSAKLWFVCTLFCLIVHVNKCIGFLCCRSSDSKEPV